MAFWVDDFPNFPRWDMLISWRVTHFSISCLGFSPGFVYETSIPGDCGRSFIDQLRRCTIRTPQAGCDFFLNKCQGFFQRKNMGYWYEFYKEHWWNDIMKSLYKSFKCDSVIYDCSFFFGFSKDSREITQDEPATTATNPWRRYDLARRDAGIATLSRCMRVLKDQKPEM